MVIILCKPGSSILPQSEALKWGLKNRGRKKKREKNRPAPADCSYKVLETEHFEDIRWCAWHSSYITVMTLPGVEVPHLGYKQRGDKKISSKNKIVCPSTLSTMNENIENYSSITGRSEALRYVTVAKSPFTKTDALLVNLGASCPNDTGDHGWPGYAKKHRYLYGHVNNLYGFPCHLDSLNLQITNEPSIFGDGNFNKLKKRSTSDRLDDSMSYGSSLESSRDLPQ